MSHRRRCIQGTVGEQIDVAAAPGVETYVQVSVANLYDLLGGLVKFSLT
ncbi:MAG: hypothetical protein LC750_15260 [Actinobacteria bacterium]|nr:hypothetical protein [Actinomycetota bacterium]